MSKMKLITEYTDTLVEFKTQKAEGADGLEVKEYFIEGIFMQADQENRNGRIYEKKILKPAVDKYIEEQIKTHRAVGELNHPSSPSVNLDRASHKIESLTWKGADVIGRAKILDTPMGKIVKNLLDGGVKLGVSSRGMGSITRKENVDYVKNDFMLATIDIVQDPSAPSAFVNGIMEGVEWVKRNGAFVPVHNDPIREKVSRKFYDFSRKSKHTAPVQELKNINKSEKDLVRAFQDFIYKL